MEMRKII